MRIDQSTRIFIPGGNGVLASYLRNHFRDCIVFAPSKAALDITNPQQLKDFFTQYRPDVVLHAAAKTDVEACERAPQTAYLVNCQATANIASCCAVQKSFLVYFSTAAVFDGTKKYASEHSQKRPINVYGKSKAAAEEAIAIQLKQHLIIRLGWLIGGGSRQKKFVAAIAGQLLQGKNIQVVNDTRGTIASADELASFVRMQLVRDATGIIHFGSSGVCSRYQIAREVAKRIGTHSKITPVTSTQFQDTFFAPRPAREVLRSTRYSFPISWKASLKTYLDTEF